MFVRVKKIGADEYLYLVENAREGGHHVQRVIKVLGRRQEVEASGLIDGLIAFDRLAARRSKLEWARILDDLADLSEIEVEQDGRRARLRTAPGPTIDPICRPVGLTLPPVFREMPPAP